MRYISVFSGIEAATVAWEPLGWEPVAFCEIDAFPSAVLAHRFPNVPNLGDITKVDWSVYRGEVDVIVGGSPCQSFSIAGNRTGLDGASGLMWEYVRCVREVRPRWFVWENVPGALSSSKGEDFRCLLEIMDELGYGLAWRVLDAQFFGVPQQRRRLFLVGSLGDRRAADVLFEPDCLRRDSQSSREKRKSITAAVERGVGCSNEGCMTPWDVQSKRIYSEYGCGPCLQSGTSEGMNIQPCVAYTLKIRGGCDGGGKGALVQDDMSAKLSTSNDQTIFQPICMDAGCHASRAIAANQHVITQYGCEIAGTLVARHDSSPCADRGQNVICIADDNAKAATDENMCGSLKVGGSAPIVSSDYIVRRLTPIECERLQGFPDEWTNIEWKGKKAPDGKRYKALGNSMAVPVMRWIGGRIDAVYSGAKAMQDAD